MNPTYILFFSLVAQIAAAVLAIRLIRISEYRSAWSLVATALVLMVVRRAVLIYHALSTSGRYSITDYPSELIGLLISLSMAIGFALIEPAIRSGRRSQEAVLKREAWYRMLMERSTDGIMITDRRGRCREFNQKARQLFGLADVKPNAIFFQDLVFEGLPDHQKRPFSGLAIGESRQYDCHPHRSDGSAMVTDVTIIRLDDDAFQITVRDITEHTTALEALRRSAGLYHGFMNSIDDLIYLKDDQFKHLVANDALLAFFGKSRDEVLGRTDFELMPPEAAQHCRESDQAALAAGHLITTEEKIGNRVFEIRKFPVSLPDGTIGIGGNLADVTEFKLTNRGLAEKTAELNQFFSVNLDLLCIADFEGNFRRLNPAWEQSLGYSLEELSAINFLELVHPDDLEATRTAMQVLSTGKEVANFANRYRCKDGSYRWIEWRSAPHGQLIYAAARDITERKLAEEKSRESEQKYRATFETTGTATILVAEDTTILMVNQEFERLSGYKREEVEGKMSWTVFAAKEDVERMLVQHRQRRVDREAAMRSYEFQFVRRSGEQRSILLTIDVIPGTGLSVASLLDITERKQEAEALKESERLFRTLADRVPVGIFQSNLKGETIYVNDRWCRITGLSRDRATGSLWTGPIHPDEAEQVIGQWKGAALTGRDFTSEYRLLAPDGRIAWIFGQAIPIRDSSGTITGHLGILWDVTERNLAVQSLKHREQFEHLIMAISSRFINLPPEETDAGIYDALRAMGEFTGGDRCYVYQCSADDPDLVVRTHEWRRIGTESFNALSLGLRLGENRQLVDAIASSGYVNIPRLDDYVEKLGPAARELFDAGVKSMVILPLVYNKVTTGWFGVGAIREHREWAADTVDLLRIVGEIFTNAIEHRRVNDILKQSEEKYRTLIETTGTGYVILDREGLVVDANAEYVRMTGHESLAALRGRSVLEWTAEVERQKNAAAIQDCFAVGKVNALEICYVDGSGTITPIEINATVVEIDGERLVMALCRDISRRRRAEEGLQKSEALYRTLFEYANDAIFIMDHDQFVDCNAQTLAMFKCAREEIIGRRPDEFSPSHQPDGRTSQEKALEKIRATLDGAPQSFEWVHCHKDGTPFFAEVSLSKVPALGETALQAIVRDISVRKQAELARENSERRLNDVIDFLPEATFAIDRERKVIVWNRAMEAITGVKAENILGRGDFEYGKAFYGEPRPILIDMALDPSENVRSRYVFVEESGRVLTGEARVSLRGATRYLWGKASPLYNSDGEVVGAIESVRDITERKLAEEALSRSQAQLKGLTENLPGVVYQLYFRPTGEVGFHYISAKTLEILGYPHDMANAFDFFISRVDPEDRDRVQESVQEALRTRSSWENEMRYHKADGKVIWIKLFARPQLRDDELIYNGILLDITERKRMEEERERLESQLRRSQKLETVGTLAAGVAHDFNNLLVPVINYTELAIADIGDENPAAESLQEVLKAGNRARDLVAQLLTYSRQKEGERKPLTLAPIIKEAVKLLGRTLPPNVVVRQEISSPTVTVSADATQLHQVVMNLCINAGHAMPDGGTLTISLSDAGTEPNRCAVCGDTLPRPYVQLTFSDTGVGMDEATLQRIFDPFFTTKPAGKGSGLGLAVTHSIIEQHQGHICVTSAVGKGTTFHVYLPAVDSPLLESDNCADAPKGGTESILLVDSDVVSGETVARVLERLGYTVTLVSSSVDALGLFHVQPSEYDLAIIEHRMPEFSGDQLAEELLRRRPEIPILLIVESGAARSNFEARAIPFADLLTKPLPVNELDHRIRTALNARAVMTSSGTRR